MFTTFLATATFGPREGEAGIMRIVYFSHSLVSCWNHGNAHFQRGVLLSLQKLGHDVIGYEPADSWSRSCLAEDQGSAVIDMFIEQFPTLPTRRYLNANELEQAVDGADLVIVHEWNDPRIVKEIGRLRRRSRFMALFHDTHHRAVSDPDAIRRFDLSGYDGILAFGETLARIYENWGWTDRVFVWHEAADTSLFRPPEPPTMREGAIWVGNWGDGERTAEIETFLLAPANNAAIQLDIHGVRYPQSALVMLQRYGARFHGWVANATVPTVFAAHRFTVHVPRRYYTKMLPGIPTIRVFEALACGIPLITAPWDDSEKLFRPNEDYLVAHTESEMQKHMRAVSNDTDFASALAAAGLSRILSHHSCDVRALELIQVATRIAQDAVAA